MVFLEGFHKVSSRSDFFCCRFWHSRLLYKKLYIVLPGVMGVVKEDQMKSMDEFMDEIRLGKEPVRVLLGVDGNVRKTIGNLLVNFYPDYDIMHFSPGEDHLYNYQVLDGKVFNSEKVAVIFEDVEGLEAEGFPANEVVAKYFGAEHFVAIGTTPEEEIDRMQQTGIIPASFRGWRGIYRLENSGKGWGDARFEKVQY